jgi:hypothetical protein
VPILVRVPCSKHLENDPPHLSEEYISKRHFIEVVKKLKKQIKRSNHKIELLTRRTESVTDKIKSFKSLKQELSGIFSYNGYSSLLHTKNFFKKVFCIICMIALFSACVFYVAENYSDFKEYNVLTQIKIKENKTMLFPAVTVCLYDSKNRALVIDLGKVLNDCYYDSSKSKFSKTDFENFNVTNARRGDVYNCYKFNGGLDFAKRQTSILTSKKFGKYTGLTLNLTLTRNEIMFYYVGDNSVKPVFSEFTNFIQTGKSVFIGIIKKRFVCLFSLLLF